MRYRRVRDNRLVLGSLVAIGNVIARTLTLPSSEMPLTCAFMFPEVARREMPIQKGKRRTSNGPSRVTRLRLGAERRRRCRGRESQERAERASLAHL